MKFCASQLGPMQRKTYADLCPSILVDVQAAEVVLHRHDPAVQVREGLPVRDREVDTGATRDDVRPRREAPVILPAERAVV